MHGLHHVRRGAGPPLLLLHGLGGEHSVWDPVLADLAADHDVVAADLPGFGRSPALDVTPTPAALAVAVAGLLDDLGIDTAHIAGNSLGAWVALELALLGRARSVLGLCPAGLWSRPSLGPDQEDPGRAQRLARRVRPLVPLLMLVPRVRRAVLAPFVARPERVPYRDAWRMVAGYGRATAYAATSTAMRQDRFRGAAAVDVPVTLAFGELDRLIRPATMPGARALVLPGCGHIPMWDDTPLVLGVIRSARALRGAGEPAAS